MEFMSILLSMLVLILHGTTKIFSERELLVLDYYKETCPSVEEIVRRNVEIAVLRDPRMAASLLRLHFHDCFVMVRLLFHFHFHEYTQILDNWKQASLIDYC